MGQPVTVRFDALPGREVAGRISAISGAPEPKAEWGTGRYYSLDLALDEADALPLRPGMSVRVDAEVAPATAPVATAGVGE